MKDKLKELIKNSYAPYSGFHFASIVETEDGNFYGGVNVENSSYGGTICAERNAINNAVSNGKTKFKALYLMFDGDHLCFPCHICKQTFTEFFDENVIFNIMNTKGDMKVLSYKDIMNTTFDKEDLR